MKEKIFLSIFFIIFASSFALAYNVGTSINPGQMEFSGDMYHGSIILGTLSGAVSSDNYNIQVGFLHQIIKEEQKKEIMTGGTIFDRGFSKKNKYIWFSLALLVFMIAFIYRKEIKQSIYK